MTENTYRKVSQDELEYERREARLKYQLQYNTEISVAREQGLAQGFAKGLGIEEPINSPTFTIVQEYTQGRIPLYHFDVYRISDVSEMDEIGYEEYFYSDGVCLVEWGKLIDELFPDNTTYISISKDLSKGFDYRKVEVATKEMED